MTTLLAVLEGIKNRLETIVGLSVFDYIPEDITTYPAAVILPPTFTDYTDSLDDGSVTVTISVMLFAPATVDRQQLALVELIDRTGPMSVYAAVMADRTLGGLDVDCRVVDAVDPLDRGLMATSQVYQRAVSIHAVVS